jgi:two-component system sensor histidine kinase KdpD
VAIQRLKRLAAHHEIRVDIPEELPLVFVDAVLMEQVFINLLNNSLKFTPPEKIIRVSATEETGTLKVTIQNQGPPIPEASLQHIFEKFAIAPGFENPKSTGLGLSICKGIVEAHSGRIWAANLPDGVAFYFSLPLSAEGARPVLPQEE